MRVISFYNLPPYFPQGLSRSALHPEGEFSVDKAKGTLIRHMDATMTVSFFFHLFKHKQFSSAAPKDKNRAGGSDVTGDKSVLGEGFPRARLHLS